MPIVVLNTLVINDQAFVAVLEPRDGRSCEGACTLSRSGTNEHVIHMNDLLFGDNLEWCDDVAVIRR